MPKQSLDGTVRDVGGPGQTASSYEEKSSTLTAFSRLVSLWLVRRRHRRALAYLVERDNYLLADVGLTRQEAQREGDKPFWRA